MLKEYVWRRKASTELRGTYPPSPALPNSDIGLQAKSLRWRSELNQHPGFKPVTADWQTLAGHLRIFYAVYNLRHSVIRQNNGIKTLQS